MTLEILQTSQKQNSAPSLYRHNMTHKAVIFSKHPEFPFCSVTPTSLRRCPGTQKSIFCSPSWKYTLYFILERKLCCENAQMKNIFWSIEQHTSSAECGYLNMFIWNLLINISKQLGVYLLQAALKINTSCGKMGRQTLDTILPRDFNCSCYAKSPDRTKAYYSADKTHQVEYDCYKGQGGYHYQCLSND